MSWKSRVENPIIIQKIVTHSNKKRLIVSINVEDNIIDYCMGDVEIEVVFEGGTSRDANQNEEHDISDVDVDMDYDM